MALMTARLAPMKHEESVVERISMPWVSNSLEFLLAAVDTLLKRAYSRPEMRGRYARQGRPAVRPLRERPPGRGVVHFKQSAGNPERASFIIRSRLETDRPQAPVEEVMLTLAGLTGESGVQMGLLPDVREGRERHLVEVERQLQSRTGRRQRPAPGGGGRPPGTPLRRCEPCRSRSTRGEERGLKPISTPTVAIEVREGLDGEPIEVRAWQGAGSWSLKSVEDTWSFDLWWMPRPLTRTYYRVSREDGRLITLFRGPPGRLLVQAARLVTRVPAVTAGYVELHSKSFYSFGMGASHAHEMLSKAVGLGYPAMALTDTNLCGALEFARLAGSLGVQPVTGGELTLMDGSRLVMLAKTREGYANISRLFTLANSEDRRKPRLDPAPHAGVRRWR